MSTIKVQNIQHTASSTNAISLASDGTCTANITNNLSNKRININGSINVNQRGNTTGITSTGYHGPDRFRSTIYGGTFSFSQADSGSTLPEFPKCFKVDCTSAASAPTGTQECKIGYDMEGQDVQHLCYGSSSAKKTTLTFYIRSNKTETYTVWYYRPDGGGRMNGVNFSVSSANTWEKKTITIDGDTTEVIPNDNTSGLKFEFVLASGTDYKSGSALNGNWAARVDVNRYVGNTGTFGQSTDDVIEITGIQFEVSDYGTSYEHRSFGQELELCKRYYQVLIEGDDNYMGGVGYQYSGTLAITQIQFTTEMRITPVLVQGSGTNYYKFYINGTSTDFNSFTGFTNTHKRGGAIYWTSNNTQGTAGAVSSNDAGAKIHFAAEL